MTKLNAVPLSLLLQRWIKQQNRGHICPFPLKGEEIIFELLYLFSYNSQSEGVTLTLAAPSHSLSCSVEATDHTPSFNVTFMSEVNGTIVNTS